MPKASTKKTASALKLTKLFPRQIIALTVLLCVMLAFAYAASLTRGSGCVIKRYYGEMNRFTLFSSRLPYHCVYLEPATTAAARERGLSERPSLDADSGMLFVLEQPQRVCLWMKDMRFSIDMIWVNAKGHITRLQPNVSPETFPAAFCQNDTKYVIELKAGGTAAAHLHVGDRLKL